MVSNNTRAAIILGVALILSAFLYGGVYESRTEEHVLWRLNRFTGEVVFCGSLPLGIPGTCGAVFPETHAALAAGSGWPTPAPGESDAAFGKRVRKQNEHDAAMGAALLGLHPELDAPPTPASAPAGAPTGAGSAPPPPHAGGESQ